MRVLLSMTYFGPVQWYQKLYRYNEVIIERFESFQKQTYRNRCVIATTNGLQPLIVPVERPECGDLCHTPIGKLRISNHGNWRHVHWAALESAYSESPFFEYYADDLYPFFDEKWDNLFDLNIAICQKICELIDIRPHISISDEFTPFNKVPADVVDFRHAINPKRPSLDADFSPQRYYQVYERKFGFLPNLSILDLLFNMGPEAVFMLM